MKKLITTTLIIIFLVSNGMSQVFDGISISGDFNVALQKFKSKGYKVEEVFPEGAILSGKVASANIELFLFKTPKTSKVFKASVYFPKKDNWYDLKNEFNSYHNLLLEKYGKTTDRFQFFSSPYYDGDGYEMQAVEKDKCTYSSYWSNIDGASYSVEITKYKQVKITYENDELFRLKDKEASEIKSQIF
jgi:hypothetical protein